MKYIKIIVNDENSKPKNIIIFDSSKNKNEILGMQKLLNDKSLDLNLYFSKEEMKKYELLDLHRIINIVNDNIFLDDTIYMLYNTVHNILELDDNNSYEEIYFYYEEKTKLNVSDLFEKLTQTHEIEVEDINRFIHNFNILKAKYKSKINFFEFNDLLKEYDFLTEKKSLTIKKDFNENYIDPNEENEENKISEHTFNQQLCDFIKNDENVNIYMYNANDVLKNEENIKSKINIYFPLLAEENIQTYEQYKNWKSKKVYMNKEKYDNIHNLKIILNKKNETNNKSLIENLEFTIKPNQEMYIVLNTLFHVIELDEKIPLVKYSPGKKEEKIFRIYSHKYSQNLKQKVPYLPRTFILKITNELSRSNQRSVSCLIEYKYKKKLIPIIIEIMDDGNCNVSLQNVLVIENKKYNKFKFTYKDAETIMKDVYNNIIDYINEKYKQENNYFSKINELNHKNILHNTNVFTYEKKIKESKNIFKNIIQIRKKLLPLFEIKESDNNYISLHYKGYQTNILNNNCIIVIERISSTKDFKIILKNINNIDLSYYVLQYIDNLLDIVGSLSFNERKFDNINILEQEDSEEMKEDKVIMKEENTMNEEEYENELNNASKTEELKMNNKEAKTGNENNKNNEKNEKKDIFGLDLDENENDDELFGGGKSKEDRGYRQMRIEERDPQIMKNNDKVHPNNKWSVKCQKNSGRQPIIINEDEKKRIDQISPDSYTAPYKYGSDEDHQFYYICPEYWCIDENISINKADIKTVNGTLVSDKCKTVDDKYGKIIQGNEGKWYAKANKTVCTPCCFKTNKSNQPKYEEDKIDKKCRDNVTNKNNSSGSNKTNDNNVENKREEKIDNLKSFKEEAYIQQYNKYPLEEKKLGELPLNVKLLLNLKKDNDKELFRLGVEENNKQSFISCLSTAKFLHDAINDKKLLNIKIPTNKEFKKMMIKKIDLDLFLTLHNGNLPLLFKSNNINMKTEGEYTSDIKNTKIYKALENEKNSEKYLREIIKSYQNFKSYIKDDNNKIDHTYLWDMFLMPNENMFKNGYNLIIIEIDNMELESEARIICPTNYYSKHKFDYEKKSIVMLKYNNYYELLIKRIIHIGGNIEIVLAHSSAGIIGSFIKKVSHLFNNNQYCGLFTVDPPQLKKESKTSAIYLKKVLEKNKFKILNQIIYFNGKVIGFQVEYNDDDENISKVINYVPCKQSGIIKDIPMIFINEDKIYFDYHETKNILKYIFHKTNTEYDLLPKKKVVTKNKVLGFETSNKLFVPIYPIIDEKKVEDELEEKTVDYGIYFNNKNSPENFINIDSKITLKNKENKKNNKNKKKLEIILENEANYEKFKILVRNVINKTELRMTKNIFLTILRQEETYEKKMEKIFHQLKKILNSLSNEIDGSLINDEYVYKVSDEIIRHDRMFKYYFIDSNYILFSDLNENKTDKSEILLPQSMLLEENLMDNNNDNNILDDVKETYMPDKRYILDYTDGVNLNNIANNETLFNDLKEEGIIDKETKKKLPCGKRCEKNTRCDTTLNPPKCIPIKDNNSQYNITIKRKRGRPKKVAITMKNNTERKIIVKRKKKD